MRYCATPLRYRLPYGFRVAFKYAPDVGLTAEWTPDTPSVANIKGKRAQRKFFAAYRLARDDFMRDIATMIGGPVIIADVGGNLGGVTVIEPGAPAGGASDFDAMDDPDSPEAWA